MWMDKLMALANLDKFQSTKFRLVMILVARFRLFLKTVDLDSFLVELAKGLAGFCQECLELNNDLNLT